MRQIIIIIYFVGRWRAFHFISLNMNKIYHTQKNMKDSTLTHLSWSIEIKCSPFKVDTESLRDEANLADICCRFTTEVITDRLMLNMIDFAFAFWCCKMYDVWCMCYSGMSCFILLLLCLYDFGKQYNFMNTKLLVVVTDLVENARIKYLSRWFSMITSVMLWCTPSITGTFELTSPLNFHLVW